MLVDNTTITSIHPPLSSIKISSSNWWDHCLTLEDKIQILEHKALVELSDSSIVEESDACDFQILTIRMHFVVNPREELVSSKVVITNIRCPTLGDYRWYKDIFLTYVLIREDCNTSFWKERLIT